MQFRLKTLLIAVAIFAVLFLLFAPVVRDWDIYTANLQFISKAPRTTVHQLTAPEVVDAILADPQVSPLPLARDLADGRKSLRRSLRVTSDGPSIQVVFESESEAEATAVANAIAAVSAKLCIPPPWIIGRSVLPKVRYAHWAKRVSLSLTILLPVFILSRCRTWFYAMREIIRQSKYWQLYSPWQVTDSPSLFLTEIKVSDWPKTVRWYVETLGLRLVLDDPDHQYALLNAGHGRLALKGGRSDGLGRDGMILIFQVPEVEAERGRLLGLGVAVSPAVDHPGESYREIRLHDPEGTPIRLFSRIRSKSTPEVAA